MRGEYPAAAGSLLKQHEKRPLDQPPASALAPADPSSAALVALRAAEGTAIMRSLPGVVVVFDHDLRYVSAGGTGLSEAGFSRSMLEGRIISQVWSPEVVALIEPLYRKALAGQESGIDVPLAGRTYRQLLGPLRDADGRIVAGIGFTQDVTQARRAEREAHESEQRFRLAFSSTPIASALVGFDGRFQQANPAMCRMLGYPESRLCELAVADVTHPDDLDRVSTVMAALRNEDLRAGHKLEKRYLTATGTTVWAAVTASVLRHEDGSPLQIVAQVQDITARKEYEHVLAEEQRRFRDAELIGRVGSWEMEVETGTITWSTGVFELYGIDPDRFDGDHRKAMRCIDPADLPKVMAAIDGILTGGSGSVRYQVVRVDDGARRWIDGRGRALYEDGRLVRIAGAIADITDQVTAQAELAEVSTFHKAVFSASPDVISVWDFESGSRSWSSRSVPDLLGYEAADIDRMAGDQVGQLVFPGDRARFDAATAAARVAPGAEVVELDFRVVCKDGSTRWFSRRAAALARDDHGRVTQMVAVMRDATEEMAVTDALLESKALFDQLAVSIEAAFLLRTWNPPEFLYVSPGFEKLFGYNPVTSNVTPEASLTRVHPDDLDEMQANYWTPAKAGLAVTAEYRILRTDGQVRWIRATAAPVAYADGNLGRSASTVEDITESRDAAAALQSARDAEKANDAKSRFLSRMSHELRTPLNAVLGFAQLMQLDPLTDDQRNAVGHILQGGRHLVRLIDDVLDISKIETDRLDITLTEVSVVELLTESVEVMSHAAATALVSLRYPKDGGAVPSVLADHGRLHQVVLNLLSNAIKYNRSGGFVDVTCSVIEAEPDGAGTASGTAGAYLNISVTDTGRGIRSQDLPRLFTPFDRLGAQATGIEGTGVGLAISHRLLTLMGGTLTATSEFGSGSTFTASIPLAAGLPASTTEPPAVQPAVLLDEATDAPRRTLLYIEDNSSNIELMKRLVGRRPGWQLLVATHGELGLDLATITSPDLILLDLHLPDGHGLDILQRLRANPDTADLTVVVVSADANPHQLDRLIAAGAHAYLTKPLDLSKVLELLT